MAMQGAQARRSEAAPFYPPGPPIATLTYQSRTAGPASEDGLAEILKQARGRNRQAGVTGMLLFSGERFFQWLEGPEEGLSAIWDSIQRDPRHTEVELLNREMSRHRLFSDWDMRLVSPEAMFETVCHQTRAKRSLPPKLVELTATLALEGGQAALREGLEDVLATGVDLPHVYAGLIEPAAHLLGDWWREDLCSEREIALALYALRSVVREVAEGGLPASDAAESRLQVLLVSPPGEPHMLGVSLANDLYHQAGYGVAVEFPKTHAEVAELVAGRWVDVLTMATSDVFARYEQIDAIASAIASARLRSRNPDMVVVAGGRAFTERPRLITHVGADAIYTTLSDMVEAAHAGLAAREAARAKV